MSVNNVQGAPSAQPSQNAATNPIVSDELKKTKLFNIFEAARTTAQEGEKEYSAFDANGDGKLSAEEMEIAVRKIQQENAQKLNEDKYKGAEKGIENGEKTKAAFKTLNEADFYDWTGKRGDNQQSERVQQIENNERDAAKAARVMLNDLVTNKKFGEMVTEAQQTQKTTAEEAAKKAEAAKKPENTKGTDQTQAEKPKPFLGLVGAKVNGEEIKPTTDNYYRNDVNPIQTKTAETKEIDTVEVTVNNNGLKPATNKDGSLSAAGARDDIDADDIIRKGLGAADSSITGMPADSALMKELLNRNKDHFDENGHLKDGEQTLTLASTEKRNINGVETPVYALKNGDKEVYYNLQGKEVTIDKVDNNKPKEAPTSDETSEIEFNETQRKEIFNGEYVKKAMDEADKQSGFMEKQNYIQSIIADTTTPEARAAVIAGIIDKASKGWGTKDPEFKAAIYAITKDNYSLVNDNLKKFGTTYENEGVLKYVKEETGVGELYIRINEKILGNKPVTRKGFCAG